MWSLSNVTLPGRLRPRLDNLTLEISEGVTAVMGASGAGKTSLLNLLAGFEKPVSGNITSPEQKWYWVPQNAGLWPHLSASDHLTAVGAADPSAWLSRFDLTALADSKPATLSLGEQSRLAIARALASQAPVLLMDEPLVHVDPAREHIYWEIIRAHAPHFVYTTHVPEKVLGTADQVICLDQGRCLSMGSPEDLYYRPATEQLAGFMGPFNWSEQPCLRPEQIAVVSAPESSWQVARVTFAGSVEQVILKHIENNVTKTLWHRPMAAGLKAGDRVRIEPLA